MDTTNTPSSPLDHDTQPVPKEGQDTIATSYQENTTGSQSGAVPASTPQDGVSPGMMNQQTGTPESTVMSETVSGQQQGVGTAEPQVTPPQSPQVQKEKVIIKKGGGCGVNKTTCCLWACGGCILLVLGIVLAIIFAAPTVSDVLNKALNSGINIPQVEQIALESVDGKIDSALTSSTDNTVTLSEAEFNALVNDRIKKGTEGEQQLDVRFDFEEDAANILVRFNDLMPWGVIEIVSDESGNLTIQSVKIGPLDVSTQIETSLEKYQQQIGTNVVESDQIDVANLLGSFLFEDEDSNARVTSVSLQKDAIKLTVSGS